MKNRMYRLFSTAAALGLTAGLAQADVVHLDDVIIDGSLCVGQDCVNGEAFGFDTIRLKENNLRIKFQDTSTSASFPSNDWQLTANATSNGGANKFSIDDITGGRTPFTIEASAPTNALYVDDAGRLGLGTASPVVDIQAVTGNTPTLRLEQDGSSGFTAQIFDMAANETNFFIRDVTNGSKLPFRIKPGAPTNAIYVDADGDVALGKTSPDAPLHVYGSDGDTEVRIEEASGTTASRTVLSLRNNGITAFNMIDTSTGGGSWGFTNRGSTNSNEFRITNPTGAGEELRLTQTGDLIITGTITTTGTTCGGGCDAVFEADYDLPSIEEHSSRMFALGYLPNVGPTPEGEPFDMTDKLGRMLNELEHAHIFIAKQDERISELEARNSELVASLEARLEALEQK